MSDRRSGDKDEKRGRFFAGGSAIAPRKERAAVRDINIDIRMAEEEGREPTPELLAEIEAELGEDRAESVARSLSSGNGRPRSTMSLKDQEAAQMRIWTKRRAEEREVLRALVHKRLSCEERDLIRWRPGYSGAEGSGHLGGGW